LFPEKDGVAANCVTSDEAVFQMFAVGSVNWDSTLFRSLIYGDYLNAEY
jgi:hypothetical protein